jgi:plasmid stabilization system protein ParE
MRLRIARQARTDLDQIWLYTAQESGSTDAATRLVSAITEQFALFARFPFIGRSLENSRRPNVRTFPVHNHLIFYSTRPGEVRILRVIHSSRDAFAVFAGE